MAEKLDQQVLVPVFDTPEQFAASVKKERDGWAEFIRRNNVMPDSWAMRPLVSRGPAVPPRFNR